MVYRFEWNSRKASANIGKHGVAFEEASTVFRDAFAVIFDDDEHSDDEHREIIVGHSTKGRLMIVSFTERMTGVIRIISARPATKKERGNYEKNDRI